MNTLSSKKSDLSIIFHANGTLQAMVVRNQFEQGGIPAVLCDGTDSIDVLVPTAYQFQAQSLMQGAPTHGEIYLYQG